jgi:hypothetical protein
MAGILSASELHQLLTRWVDEELIDAEQAARIEAAEAAEPVPGEPPARTSRRPSLSGPADYVPLVVEALGYLGSALAVIAAVIAVDQLWPDIPVAAQLMFAGIAAVALGVTGAAIRTDGDPAFRRLRSVLWLMSTAGTAAFMSLLAARIWHVSPEGSTVVAAAVTTGYAAVLLWHTPSPVQHLAAFLAAAVAVGSGIAWIDADVPDWASGVGVWSLAALWLPAVRRGLLRPRATGYLTASIGLLTGAVLTMEVAAGRFLALGTAAGLLLVGVLARRVWLLALGAVGVIMVVPQIAVLYLPGSAGTPLSLFVVGLALLGGAIWLARQWKRPRSG